MNTKNLSKEINSIEFTGRNACEIKSLLNLININLQEEENGRISIDIEGDNIAILKEDKILICAGRLKIIKPNYVFNRLEREKV